MRAGDPWCTLCWTDLRPKPAPPPPPAPAPEPVPAYAPATVAAAVPVAAPAAYVDPLTAPLGALLGEPLAADPAAPSAVTWPCVECGNANAMDLNACSVCTTPFGGRIARLDDAKGERRRRFLLALGAMVAFLVLLALATFAMTDTSGIADDTEPPLPVSDVPLPPEYAP